MPPLAEKIDNQSVYRAHTFCKVTVIAIKLQAKK